MEVALLMSKEAPEQELLTQFRTEASAETCVQDVTSVIADGACDKIGTLEASLEAPIQSAGSLGCVPEHV